MKSLSEIYRIFYLFIYSRRLAKLLIKVSVVIILAFLSESVCFRENVLQKVEQYNLQNSALIYHFNILSVSPGLSTVNIPTGSNILVEFDDNIDMASVTGSTFYVTPAVAGAFSYNAQLKTVIFDPTAALAPTTVYTVYITTGITNVEGETLATDYSWSFTTAGILPEIEVISPLAEILTGATYDFGNAVNPSTKSQVFTIRNSGTSDLIISSSLLSGTNSSEFSISSFPSSPVASGGGTTTITVMFQPAVAVTPPEIKNAILTISNNDADESSFVINLEGTALNSLEPEIQITQGGVIMVSPVSTVDFGTVTPGDTGTISMVMHNIGSANLSVSAFSFGGTNPDLFTTDFGPVIVNISAGTNINFNINFSPVAKVNARAEIVFQNNDTSESNFVLKLKGRAK